MITFGEFKELVAAFLGVLLTVPVGPVGGDPGKLVHFEHSPRHLC